MVEGAHKIWKRPNTHFIYFLAPIGVMFPVKHWLKGYDFADFL